MASIFTKIVNNEIPAYKVAETEKFLAFLDISPVTKGHTLVIPKKEIGYIFDLNNDLYTGLHLFAKKVAKGIKKAVACKNRSTCSGTRGGTCAYTPYPHAKRIGCTQFFKHFKIRKGRI